jgi:hypothetical protein
MYVVQRHDACHTTMKTTLIAALLVAAAGMGVEAQPPGTTTDNFQAPTAPRTHPKPAPPISQRPTVDGVIPRAIRNGSPWQMLNPRAPRRYGTSQEAVTYDQDDPYKWRGIKFFEIRF